MKNLINQMRALEVDIARQQAYITKHGKSNDSGEYDEQWEQYKKDAQYNLDKWDKMKAIINEREATIEDFKIGTVLIDSEGNEFGIRRKYEDGIWESNYSVHFENEARFYKVRES